MKKSIFISAFFAAAMLYAAEENQNTTVSEIKDNFTSTIWEHWNPDEVKAEYRLNKKEGASDKGAAQIEILESGSACFFKDFNVAPASLYLVEVMVKSANKNVKADISVLNLNSEKKIMGKSVIDVTSEWQKITYFFRTAKEEQKIHILLNCDSPAAANILFDDFKISKIEGLNEFYDTFAANSWKNWSSLNAKINFEHDTVEGKKYPGALKIEVLPDNKIEKYSGCATFHIPVIPGKTYQITVYAKSKDLDPDATIFLSYQAQDENFHFLGLPLATETVTAAECANWKQIMISRKIPNFGKWAKIRNLLVKIGVKNSINSGTVWFDDFEFCIKETE